MTDELIYELTNDCDEHEVDEFKYLLQREIYKYNKRYNTVVTYVLLFGNIGTWRGRFKGGKLVRGNADAILGAFNGDYSSFKLYKEKDTKELYIVASHHDSSHTFKFYLITENKSNILGISFNTANNPNNLITWASKLKPIKV